MARLPFQTLKCVLFRNHFVSYTTLSPLDFRPETIDCSTMLFNVSKRKISSEIPEREVIRLCYINFRGKSSITRLFVVDHNNINHLNSFSES